MPLGDKTGPRGLGARTGRGLGSCPPSAAEPKNPVAGFGLGRGPGRRIGRGLGRGRWGRFSSPLGR